jgi:hypothetical protein
LLSTEVTFDLSPYADYYNEAYATEGGIIITNYGTYSFGDLSCQDRTLAAEAQAREAAQATLQEDDGSAGPVCSSDADCEWASVDTTCSAACGAIVSTLHLDQFSTALDAIETHTCADFADGCDPVVVPPCVPPPALACQNNTCVIAEL